MTEDKRYISPKEAADIFGYAPDYISYLIRNKKIEGKRVGRDWFTTEKAIRVYLQTKKFFPLKDLLLSKIDTKVISIIIVAGIILAVYIIFLISNSPIYYQRLRGDFIAEEEIQDEDIVIQQPQEKESKIIKVTTYLVDNAGGFSLSVQPEPISDTLEEESFFIKIAKFLKGIF